MILTSAWLCLTAAFLLELFFYLQSRFAIKFFAIKAIWGGLELLCFLIIINNFVSRDKMWVTG